MPMNTETVSLFQRVLGLAEKDRAILLGLLLESLEERDDIDSEALWRIEVAKRVEELDSGIVPSVSWEEVKSRLLKESDDQLAD
jgi:putative addiction module component (TIGR02574 family)